MGGRGLACGSYLAHGLLRKSNLAIIWIKLVLTKLSYFLLSTVDITAKFNFHGYIKV